MRKFSFCPALRLAAILLALATGPLRAELPPEVQAAMKKGIIAAQQQDYLLACRFFQDARKLAPDAPEVFYNLGLAESRIPGRELRAMAWFGAYLSAYPDVPNAAAVKEQIEVLDVKNQSNTSRLIKQVQDAASQVSGDNGEIPVYLAELWAEAGDITVALKTADLIQSDIRKSRALNIIAEAQAKAGDIAGAQMTTELIRDASDKSSAQLAIAQAQAEGGDIAGALKTADLIQNADYKRATQIRIATAQAKAGDIVGALKTADLILGISPNGMSKNAAQLNIAVAQAESGDIIGALKTTDRIQDAYYKRHAQSAIAEAQINAGDITNAQKTLASAQKTAELIQDAGYKSSAQRSIALAKASIANAPNSTRQSTATTQSPVQPAAKVTNWLKLLDDDFKLNDCPLNTDPFMDLASYLKSLPPSDDPKIVFKSLHKTAEKIVGAQIVITGMLKQQAGK